MFTCAIVEDDNAFVSQLVSYLEKVPFFSSPVVYTNGMEALKGLSLKPVDLIFLDYNLPEMTGLALFESLPLPTTVIMITVDPQAAVDCFDIDCVVDYLVKPFSHLRFLRAIGRSITHLKKNIKESDSDIGNITTQHPEDFIYLKSGRRSICFQLSDILYAQAFGAYIKIYTAQGYTMIDGSFAQFESKLHSTSFMRIHKSYIINLRHVLHMDVNEITMPNMKIEVGITYRPMVKQFINNSKPLPLLSKPQKK